MAKARGSRFGTKLAIVIAFVVALGVGGVVGLILVKRAKTGEWSMPNGNDLLIVKNVFKGKEGPSKVIYMVREKITIEGGDDDASKNRSSIIGRHSPDKPVTMPGYSGSKKGWASLVRCVVGRFHKFDVRVTDERPTDTENYIMVVVGGKPKHIGAKENVSGLAPFNSKPIPRAVVFGFADVLGNRLRPVCETIAMEVAHAYGLDHSYSCRDVMSYKTGCGARGFYDKDLPCGEKKARICANGEQTQNSYQHLLGLLGPAKFDPLKEPPPKSR